MCEYMNDPILLCGHSWDYKYSNKREMTTFYLPLTFRPTVVM